MEYLITKDYPTAKDYPTTMEMVPSELSVPSAFLSCPGLRPLWLMYGHRLDCSAEWLREHGIPVPPPSPPLSELRKEAAARAENILANYNLLQSILYRHEDTIRSKWLKKNRKQQQAILLAAWPDMAPAHRPDFEALKRELSAPASELGTTRFRDWFLWPNINVEDLTLKKNLLYMLHSRGRNPPGIFAHADLNRTRIARASGALRLAFADRRTMLLDGLTTASYGQITLWDKHDDAENICSTTPAFSASDGMLILEIQERHMGFLVKSCQSILPECSDAAVLMAQPVLFQNILPPIATSTFDYPTAGGLAIERQYREPSQFDYRRLQAMVGSKKAEAEDYIWALREDPGVFAETITDWSEHCVLLMRDTHGKEHFVGPNKSQDYKQFWEHVLAHAITNAYDSLIIWHILGQHLDYLQALERKYRDAITPDRKDLADEYLQALLTFRQMLNEAETHPINDLRRTTPSSPLLRSLYVRKPNSRRFAHSVECVIQARSPSVGKLLFILETLWEPLKSQCFSLADLLDQLEHLILTQPSEKARLSPLILGLISDIGVLSQVRAELESYRPGSVFDQEFEKGHDERVRRVSERFYASCLISANVNPVMSGLASLGSPSYVGKRRFYYPSDKRRTKETTHAMRVAEHDLDSFWARFDANFKSATGKTINEIVEGFTFENRDMLRTPEWVEPEAKPKKAKALEPFQESFPKGNEGEACSSGKAFPAPESKTKTRGMASMSRTTDLNVPVQSQNVEDTRPSIPVDRRSYKVFKALFFTPDLRDIPGEVPWVEFLRALASIGFSVEKLYASVWRFTPSHLGGGPSIQFHEPHPDTKIPFKVARRMGRRLGKEYGWDIGVFVLTS